ncbi:MAG TPA: C-type lectin domain-containing protein, partial [Thermoguttaceae bacterium]|nr:C-type lectin domain-containing protein [Thermoguttaceae bacterium]
MSRSIAVAIVLSLVFCSAVLGEAVFTNEVEPNNTRVAATPLPLTQDPAGSGFFLGFGAGQQDPATSDAYSDPDYWRFEALAGDIVSIAVETPDSGVYPYVQLRDAGESVLASDYWRGPDDDAFISAYTIPVSGTYYAYVFHRSGCPYAGSYQLRVDLARGIQMEYDPEYANDSRGSANLLALKAAANHLTATVAGNVMANQGATIDYDYFWWGTVNAGCTIELTVRLPGASRLLPRVRMYDSAGAAVTDEDGNTEDGHFRATVTSDGIYYARVDGPVYWFGGHSYQLGDQGRYWTDAENYAQSLAGHLVTINSEAEQNWFYNAFGRRFDQWIGFTDQATEGTWVWASGEPATYTNWQTGEPNSGNTYNWGYMHYGNGQWYDRYEWAGNFVVEKNDAGDANPAGPGL